jgi:hypothetical protein
MWWVEGHASGPSYTRGQDIAKCSHPRTATEPPRQVTVGGIMRKLAIERTMVLPRLVPLSRVVIGLGLQGVQGAAVETPR